MTIAQRRHRLHLPGQGPAFSLAFALVLGECLSTAAGVHAQQLPWKSTVTDGATAKPGNAKAPEKPEASTKTATAAPEAPASAPSKSQSIIALVNDEPITGFEVEERITLAVMGTPELQKRLQSRLKSPKINEQFKAFAIKRLQANPPKSENEQKERVKQLQAQFVETIRADVMKEFRPVARKQALEELIEEHLKLQEAKRLNVVASNDDVDRILKGMAERNKMTLDEFTKYVTKTGASVTAMRRRISASLSWSDVIRRKYGHQIATTTRNVDHLVPAAEGADGLELHLRRILIPVASDADQGRVAQRLSDGERLRAGFAGCSAMPAQASGLTGARFDDLGARKPSTIPEPTRSLLLSAADNEMLPPSIGEGGVELWAVCGRRAVKAEQQQKRETAENDLRQKEFEILSKKHLKDLRQDAHIEFR